VADVVEKRPVAAPAAAPGSRQTSRYSRRFALAHVLVIVAFAGLLGFFAYLVSGSESSAKWSSYKPTGGETYPRAQKLANFVAPRYLSGGSPIAVIQAQPLFFHDQVVDGVAFTRAPFQDVGEHYHQLEPAGQSTMAYVFCGQAARCGLAATGAEDVIPLLRRESLELALYTFKYWPEIDSVVAILPPATKSSPAVYLKRSNFKAELSKPLERTLPNRPVITASTMTGAERAAVERLTRIYPSSFQETASGRMLLLLGTGTQ
jgi:hypothetical protein